MKKYYLHLLVVIMFISLTGIIVVQLFWIKNAVKVKEAEYDENIREVLDNAVKKLEKKNALVFITENMNVFTTRFTKDLIDGNELIRYFKSDSSGFVSIDNEDMIFVDSSEKAKQFSFVTEKKNTGEEHKITKTVILKGGTEQDKIVIHDTIMVDKSPDDIYVEVFGDMVYEYSTSDNPLNLRVDINDLDSLLKKEIIEKSIDSDYEFAIVDVRTDSIHKKSEGYIQDYVSKSFKTSLFSTDIIDKYYSLYLYLPNKNSFVYKSLSIMLLGSVFFTLVIIVIFFITTKIAFKQKKISEIKSDFINNMTHEFKTPIATISLAADSIKNPKVIHDVNKIEGFIHIIKEENKRMNSQVESVLQMSLLERETFKVDLMEHDIHVLIEKLIKNFNLKIEERAGKLDLALKAENPFALVDETHFLNVIHNLLDNAVKYSDSNLEINLNTYNENDSIKIVVNDNGIGMKKEDLVRVFDKFYRVSMGNIHNVKGFGLGLSYVKAIVSEFNGTIKVFSEKGKGSQFIISIPVTPISHEK